ncbi:4'-phosphopantetheinyl transferase family protein [Salinimicrobium sp. HB62]|uniref:4'-phosphopantetheinyl transferase family protein n=1 Tax=Salinimicrobium sp. HB62 TaxID=3077781 RepID=UPI002D78C7D3|nr:4'-phosphopantetheinyl transferase superfamily protein [Salinimicrobium sp. HB62]
MIGNDIIDLELAGQQSDWSRKGFLKKVFSEAEQSVITTSPDENLMVWLLWSMKEAAYKAHQREFNLARRLNWLAQECRILDITKDKASGTVNISGETYFTTSKFTSEYIHTSAKKDPALGVKNVISEALPSEVKHRIIEEVSDHYQIDKKELQLKKDALGIPFLSNNESFHFDRFSLSGHGKFYAYSLSLINCETSVKHS